LTHHDTHTTLALHGDLDTTTVPQLAPAVQAVLACGHRHLVIDAARLAFCDSAGLHALIGAKRDLAAAEATMHLTQVHGTLRRILDLTGLARAFTITPSPPPGTSLRSPGITRWA
jgi:anti-anti-sigma factor